MSEPQKLEAARGVTERPATDRTARTYWLLVLAPLAALAVFYLYPLSRVLWLSVTVPTPGFGNFAYLVSSDAVQRILLTTLRVCLITTALALALGYLIAYAALHVRPRHGELMLFIVLLCFWLSVLIRAFAWLMLLQSRGVVNSC
jgi:putative spermidine/putrescine transport system permease protein